MTPEQIKAVLEANGLSDNAANTLHSWRCEHPEIYGPCSCLQELVNDLAALLPEATETVEWGAKYADGRVVSCGWLDGLSERFAHGALSERPEMVLNRREAAVAVVSRVRSTTLHVTDWTEVDS